MKISITRALAEVKTLEARMVKLQQQPYAVLEVSGKIPNGTTEQFLKDAKANLQSLEDLYDRRHKIKSAIAKANAETQVTVGGITGSIIQLIDMKTSLEFKRSTYIKARKDGYEAQRSLMHKQDDILAIVNQQTNSALSNKSQIPKDTVESLRTQLEALYQPKVIEAHPISYFEDKLQEIDDFLGDLDMTLSEVNASTLIEI